MWSAKNATVSLFASFFLMASAALAQDDFCGTCLAGGFGDGIAPQGEVADITREIEMLRISHAQLQQQYKEAQQREPVASLPSLPSTTAAVKAIEEKLAARRDFGFDDITINELRAWLKGKLNVNVRLDESPLEEENIEPDVDVVSLSIESVSYRTALEELLRQLDLRFVVDANGIVITTNSCGEFLETRVYPVWDLVRSPLSEDEALADYDTFIECITSIVEPDVWSDVGGPASISSVKGTLSVSATLDCHVAIARLLAAIRSQPILGSRDAKSEVVWVPASENPRASELTKKLEQVVDLHFTDQPLSQVLLELQAEYDVPLLLDERALSDEGIDNDEEISIALENVTLAGGLKLLLGKLQLTYAFDGEIVRVTSQAVAEETLETRVYNCQQLMDRIVASNDEHARENLHQLLDTLTNHIEPDSWEDVGGPGAVEMIPQRGLLVISNTRDALEQSHQYLKTSLKARTAGNTAPSTRIAPDDVVTNVYRLNEALVPDNDARFDVVNFFESKLENSDNAPNSENDQFSMTLIGRNLVVSHRRDAQRMIQAVLQKLSVLETTDAKSEDAKSEDVNAGGIGGGMSGMGGGGMF